MTSKILNSEKMARQFLQEADYEKLFALCGEMQKIPIIKDSKFWLKMHSIACCKLGYWAEVIVINNKRIRLFPKKRKAWDTLALAHAVLGYYDYAAEVLTEAEEKMDWNISYNEPDLDLIPGIQEEYRANGKEGEPDSFSGVYWSENAMYVLYPKILKKAPNCAAAWYILAKFYGERLHYYTHAAKAAEKAVKLKPDWKPALAYHAQMLSFVFKLNFHNAASEGTEKTNEEKKRIAESAEKVVRAYEKWNKEKAHKLKSKKEKTIEFKERLTQCVKDKDYKGIISVCEEALKNESVLDLIIDPYWLNKQSDAFFDLENWKEVARVCKKRLECAVKRRELYSRYEVGKIKKEEERAFQFLDGQENELEHFAWESAYKRLETEEEDSKTTLEYALEKLKK